MGQGLAGSILALHLLSAGKRVMVIDNGHAESSSVVAAGMITPIAGRRLAKSWLLDSALNYARTFYQSCEQITRGPCFIPKTLYRLFKNEGEVARFQQRRNDPDYAPYIGTVRPPLTLPRTHADSLGSFDILNGGYLAVNRFLQATRQQLIDRDAYQSIIFEYAALQVLPNRVSYLSWSARDIIFCEGWKGAQNPWFAWLPFNSAKGNILTIQTSEPFIDAIYNQRKWILPTTPDELKIGATYTRTQLNSIPDAEAKAELLAALHTLLPDIPDYIVTHHQAGVRPLTIDNRPFIGRHPQHPRLACFNGFGSKGALHIPYLAKQFVEHLEQGTPVHPECAIEKRYFN